MISLPRLIAAWAMLPLLTSCASGSSASNDAAVPDSIANAYKADGYTLVWHDEFDGPSTVPSPDSYIIPTRGNSAWARFISSRPGLMEVADGVLSMRCKPNPDSLRSEADPGAMVSGAICTRDRFSFNGGRIEARMRVEGHPGSFPAFWLMPVSQPDGWPVSGEIDIFESINDENIAYATLHTGRSGGDDINTPGYQVPATIADWHVYGLDWDTDSMHFTLDGEVRGSVSRSTVREGLWPFPDNEFYIILNQSVGMEGGWAQPADTTHTYLTEVDWVRVYQRPGHTATGAATSPSPVSR